MMLILGVFHMFEGIIALARHTYINFPTSGLTIQVSYSQWGWVQLIAGVLVLPGRARPLHGSDVGAGIGHPSSLRFSALVNFRVGHDIPCLVASRCFAIDLFGYLRGSLRTVQR